MMGSGAARILLATAGVLQVDPTANSGARGRFEIPQRVIGPQLV